MQVNELANFESNIDELQELVSKYDTESFAGFFSFFIKQKIETDVNTDINKFESKLKDFLYLIALNVFSSKEGTEKFEFPAHDLSLMADKLNQIKYFNYPQNSNEYSDNTVIHEMALRNHFDNGVLSYVEQDFEKLRRVFSPFEAKIIHDFGLDVEFIIQICKEIELISIIRAKQYMGFMNSKEFFDFNKRIQTGKMNFSESFDLLPEKIQEAFHSFNYKAYAYLMFKAEDLYYSLNDEKVDKFLKLVSTEPFQSNLIRYYTAESPFETTPLLKLPDGNYLSLYGKQLPISIYKILYSHLFNDKNYNVKLREHRENTLEEKVAEIFRSFFPSKDSLFYENYFVIDGFEQDLLILYRGNVFIIEVKASKLREPFRNVGKAIQRIKTDFKNSIQYGFDQCKRVEDFFYSDAIVEIKDDRKKTIHTINPKEITNVFSIVVTLERFGSLQTDLQLLLEKDEDIDYPWCVYIDDLEIFLMTLKKNLKSNMLKFLDFLDCRRQMHGRIHSVDELDICASYMQNPVEFKKIVESDNNFLMFSPYEQGYFDEIYWAGKLRFKEKALPNDFYKYGLK